MNPPDPAILKGIAGHYPDLRTASAVPPRLLAITAQDLDALPTELTRLQWYTLGDSVGGISPAKPPIHNAQLAAVQSLDDILLSPGILCRIPVLYRGSLHYIFQLAEKNLRTKGQAFYKPIGGHLKHTPRFQSLIHEYRLKRKGATMPQDASDIAFFVPANNFSIVRKLILDQIFESESKLVIPPRDILQDELREELGPSAASDGIALLTEREVTVHDN